MKVLLDPGHSNLKPGAVGQNPAIQETEMNRIQAKTIQKRLIEKNITAVIIDPPKDILTEIGMAAKNYDLFLSLHLNAFNKTKDFYTACVTNRKYGKPESKALAKLIAKKISLSLKLPLYNNDGLQEQLLAVLSVAERNCKGPCVLCEAFFIDAYKDFSVVQNRAIAAGNAIADGVLEWLNVS